MSENRIAEQFCQIAERVGATVVHCNNVQEAVAHITSHAGGPIALPSYPTGERLQLGDLLKKAGNNVWTEDFRQTAAQAAASVTGVNFGIADTGTIVLYSTDEDIRLVTTLPERHFVVMDPKKVVENGLDAIPTMRAFHQQNPKNYIAYISGPSRTADIERVLTIGVHGPKELHILLVKGISDNFMEM